MRKFKSSPELKPYVVNVLERRGIIYLLRPDGIIADTSSTQFHKAVLRAKCEKRNHDEQIATDTTYFIEKAESISSLRCENPEWLYFIEF